MEQPAAETMTMRGVLKDTNKADNIAREMGTMKVNKIWALALVVGLCGLATSALAAKKKHRHHPI